MADIGTYKFSACFLVFKSYVETIEVCHLCEGYVFANGVFKFPDVCPSGRVSVGRLEMIVDDRLYYGN